MSGTAAGRIEDRLRPDTTYRVVFQDPRTDSDTTVASLSPPNLDRPVYVLGYWSIRGLASALKLMLCAACVDHRVVLYDVSESSDGGGWEKSSYERDKAWMKKEYNPLMNLPFLVDCTSQRIIVQSDAIFLFLGRKHGMLGSDEVEQSRCEELLCEIMDLRNQMVRFAYAGMDSDRTGSFENDKNDAERLCSGPVKMIMDKLELYLQHKFEEDSKSSSPLRSYSSPQCHLVGNTFSAPDFHLYEMLDQFEGLCRYYSIESLLTTRTHLKTFKTKFEKLPKIRNVIADSLYHQQFPYNNPYARFGSKPETLGRYMRGMHSPWRGKGTIDFVYPISIDDDNDDTINSMSNIAVYK